MGEIEYFLFINTEPCYMFSTNFQIYEWYIYIYIIKCIQHVVWLWIGMLQPHHIQYILYLFLFLYKTGTTSIGFITTSTATMTRVTYEVLNCICSVFGWVLIDAMHHWLWRHQWKHIRAFIWHRAPGKFVKFQFDAFSNAPTVHSNSSSTNHNKSQQR